MTTNPRDPGPPYPGDPGPNRQAGRLLGEGDPAEDGLIATGDRREQIHFEADKDQMVVARHLSRPDGPLPPQEATPGAAATVADSPPVEDVRVAPDESSVWDARPTDDTSTPEG
jgi:hypothetical protein